MNWFGIVVRGGWVIGFLMVLYSTSANAQTQHDKQEINALVQQGKQLAQEGNLAVAALRFKAASALYENIIKRARTIQQKAAHRRNHAKLLFIIAQTHQYNKQWSEACNYYIRSYHSNPSKRIKALIQKKLEALRPQVETTLKVLSAPAQARVIWIDVLGQKKQGKTPITWRVLPGKGKLQITAPRYRTYKHSLNVPTKQQVTHQAKLVLQTTLFKLNSFPSGAVVSLKGTQTYRGKAPLIRRFLPGNYQLTLNMSSDRSSV